MFSAYAYLSAYDRHKKLINDYFLMRKGSALSLQRDTSRDKTDHDVIRENHQFLWDEEADTPDTWAKRLAKKYYDKLFKEYCICDLMYYKHNKIALRWRTEKEVVVGKGQFQCGNKGCEQKEDLRTWEVNFGYIEHKEKKNALVKLRLCPECSTKLNYHTQKREVKALKRLGKNPAPCKDASSLVSTPKVTVKIEADEETEKIEKVEQEKIDESLIWKEKPLDSAEKSREQEFEEYFEDLFV